MLPALRFALLDLIHDRSRSLLSIIGLGVAIFSFMLLSALAQTFSNYLQNPRVGSTLLVVRNDLIDPSDNTLDPQVIAAAREMLPDQLSSVSPIVFSHTRLGDHVVQLRSATLADWPTVFHLQLAKGRWPAPQGEILIGDGLARDNHLDVGSEVQIYGSTFKVSGLYLGSSTAFASIWLPLEATWKLFGSGRGYQMLAAQLAPGVDAQAVRDRLQNDPRLAGSYAVYFEDYYTQQIFQRIRGVSDLMRIASLVAMLGVILGIFNTVTLSIVERSRDIGILLGIGFSANSVIRFLLMRFTLLGLAGFALGWAGAELYTIVTQAYAPIFALELPLDLQISAGILFAGLAWVICLSLLGTWYATRSLARQKIVDLVNGL